MGWDAYLEGEDVWFDWNYTHNCNPMIAKVLTTVGYEMGPAPFWESIPGKPSTAWWGCLHGLDGEAGHKVLDTIVNGLMEAPTLFRAMNPENGWGDYDTLLAIFVRMRAASAEYPTARWYVHG